jgi:hypothetical protein
MAINCPTCCAEWATVERELPAPSYTDSVLPPPPEKLRPVVVICANGHRFTPGTIRMGRYEVTDFADLTPA